MATVKSKTLSQKAGAKKGMLVLALGPFHNADITASGDVSLFIADQAYRMTRFDVAWTIAAGAGGTLQVTKCTGTQAPSAGAAMLAAAVATDGAANTVAARALSATEANLEIAAGDRICANFAVSIATLEGMVMVLHLLPLPDTRYWKSNT
jgi:hypothetical protein